MAPFAGPIASRMSGGRLLDM
eukprot:COSAG01_NODE_11088_length_2010_cov_2.363161_6_plen_20_part_01